MSTEHPAANDAEQLETDASAEWSDEYAPRTADSIEIIPRPDADACGAGGCRETEDLAAVIPPHRVQRVLCPRHVDNYVGVKVR